MTVVDVEAELAADIGRFTHDPQGYALYAYPWGERELKDSSGPREWQAKINALIKSHLSNPETRFQPLQIAVSSGHGIGKSAEVAMLIGWGMSTCEDCKIVLTANTFDQLRTKTWPEVAKWHRMSINAHWWTVTATAMTAKAPGHERLWRTDAIPWSENNTEAFAGMHNIGKRIIVIEDESSSIADKISEVIEGALTDANTEIIWFKFGNPTRNTGRFRECFGRLAHRWKGFRIDSRSVEGTNKAQIEKWIEDYGEDSDFVRVRVRGEFPRAGSNQFISSEAVANCRKYKAEGYEGLPKVMSVDVARFGDDQSVIGVRQGRKLQILGKYRGLDTVQLAERVIEFRASQDPDAIVVDGDGIGAGVIDQLNHRGFSKGLFEFHGGTTANDPVMYFNRRAEVWGLMRDWLGAGAEIPDDAELSDDLTGPEYGFSNKNQIQLERKQDMKSRGLSSPDCGDMLAMSFSVKVLPRPRPDNTPVVYHEGQQSTGWMA